MRTAGANQSGGTTNHGTRSAVPAAPVDPADTAGLGKVHLHRVRRSFVRRGSFRRCRHRGGSRHAGCSTAHLDQWHGIRLDTLMKSQSNTCPAVQRSLRLMLRPWRSRSFNSGEDNPAFHGEKPRLIRRWGGEEGVNHPKLRIVGVGRAHCIKQSCSSRIFPLPETTTPTEPQRVGPKERK